MKDAESKRVHQITIYYEPIKRYNYQVLKSDKEMLEEFGLTSFGPQATTCYPNVISSSDITEEEFLELKKNKDVKILTANLVECDWYPIPGTKIYEIKEYKEE